jgi:8-oxo-dGTP pyrophosphatase MutT (NUDIX family)
MPHWPVRAATRATRLKSPDAGRTALRPRDAATLIIVRRDATAKPRVLMGKRHASHAFMPNKFVFPGGRVDPADCRVEPIADLDPVVRDKLMARMRGTATAARARGLAMAAIRETFEEVGIIIGRPVNEQRPSSRSSTWRDFLETGHRPDLSAMRLFARAITPPGRPRRFDTRFFIAEASAAVNLDQPARAASEELLDPYWVTIDEARGLDLPSITRDILHRLDMALATPSPFDPAAPLTFQYWRGRSWQYDTI